jgi:hypothetical protein
VLVLREIELTSQVGPHLAMDPSRESVMHKGTFQPLHAIFLADLSYIAIDCLLYVTSNEPKLRKSYIRRSLEVLQSIPNVNGISNIYQNEEFQNNEGETPKI